MTDTVHYTQVTVETLIPTSANDVYTVKSHLCERMNLLVLGYSLNRPMWTALTVDTFTCCPVMVTRVPPATGPYSGRTLSTEIRWIGTDTTTEKKLVCTSHRNGETAVFGRRS